MASATDSPPPGTPTRNPNSATTTTAPAAAEAQNQPECENPQSPKTITLGITIPIPIPDSQQDDNDTTQDDVEEITALSPTVSSAAVTVAATTARRGGVGGGGGAKRKKRHPKQEKKCKQKLESLSQTFKPVPFVPDKTLDFSSREALLRRLGLWEFVHLQFDPSLRADVIIQLIANFSPSQRCSYVNGVRIPVSRPDLARALHLPYQSKKDKGDSSNSSANVVIEVNGNEENIGFVEEVVSNYMLLHEDMWMMPVEILNWTKSIKEGNFEKVDWAGLVWFMVEKELTAPSLGKCYYASHLQYLIKKHREELLREEPVRMEVDTKEEVEVEVEDDDLRLSEEGRGGLELDESNIELSLGGMDNLAKDEGEKEEKEVVSSEETMDFEESKGKEEQGPWVKGSMDGHFLRPCGLGEVGGMDIDERKPEDDEADEEGKVGDGVEEEEEEEEMGFSLSPKEDALELVGSENLNAPMGVAEVPFSSGVQIHENVPSGDFLASRVDVQTVAGGSWLFSNGHGNKREFGHIENDMPHQSLNGGNKRMRNDAPWNMKSSSEFDVCVEQVQHLMGKAKILYDAKEQAYQDMSLNQQVLMNEIQRRDNTIQQLHKVNFEEQHKRQVEVYKLERELYMMGNLLDGYRKALKETHKAFAEYRAKCPLPEEPIYRDAGSGGLVLSATELEKQRLKQEEEERQNRLLIEEKVQEFENQCVAKLESYKDRVVLLGNKLLDVQKEFNLLQGIFAERKSSEKSECAPIEE